MKNMKHFSICQSMWKQEIKNKGIANIMSAIINLNIESASKFQD
jgi:hypothetical protein